MIRTTPSGRKIRSSPSTANAVMIVTWRRALETQVTAMGLLQRRSNARADLSKRSANSGSDAYLRNVSIGRTSQRIRCAPFVYRSILFSYQHEAMCPNYVYRPQCIKGKKAAANGKGKARGAEEPETDSQGFSSIMPAPAVPQRMGHRAHSAPTPLPAYQQTIHIPWYTCHQRLPHPQWCL